MQEELETVWKEREEGWLPTLETHGFERGCWIWLGRSNAQIRRNPKGNRTA